MLIALAANDLPQAPTAERARLRIRERKLKGPSWSLKEAATQSA